MADMNESAVLFHKFADAGLERLNFRLYNDPAQVTGNYGETQAIYKGTNGRGKDVFLGFAISPSEARSVIVGFGRL